MRAILPTMSFALMFGLGLSNNAVFADEHADQETQNPQKFEQLGFKGANEATQTLHGEEAAQQAVANIQKQVEISDSETQAALLKAQRKLQDEQSQK